MTARLDRRGVENLQLEVHRLARRLGLAVAEVRVRRLVKPTRLK